MFFFTIDSDALTQVIHISQRRFTAYQILTSVALVVFFFFPIISKHYLDIKNLTTALLWNYMNRSPQQAWPSLRQSGYSKRKLTPELPYTSFAIANGHADAFDAPVGMQEDSENRHMHHDSYDQYLGSANDFSQYHASSYDLDTERYDLHDPHSSETASPFAPGNDQGLLRGARNHPAQSGPGIQNSERTREIAIPQHQPPSYMIPQRSSAAATGSPVFASMSSSPQVSIEQTTPPSELASTRQTKYEPFQHRFYTSDEAKDHRRVATRFNRTPYNDPASDCSITVIEDNRQAHVLRIYNAMTSGENAKDNRGSIAMKRWVIDAPYPPDLVEAYAHKVFDCLLAQAKEGFRGWVHNDYVADERKGDDIDKDVDCAGRLDNIILALEQEKTICEDVMNSACQIRMFVNAPRAYANRKHQNRVGNSKRGRTKDTPDPNPRPATAQRTGGRRTRARSTTIADMSSLRGTTPQHQFQAQCAPLAHPYYAPALHQPTSNSAIPNRQPPRSTPLHRPTISAPPNSFSQHLTPAMSPPTYLSQPTHAPQSHAPRMASTAPPQHQSPFMSPPPLSHGHYSAPGSPDDVKPPEMHTPWDNATLYTSVDPVLAQWECGDLEGASTSAGAFGQQTNAFVNLSDIERSSLDGGAGSLEQCGFRGVWGLQHDGQKVAYDAEGGMEHHE
jgi:hypothetical protein